MTIWYRSLLDACITTWVDLVEAFVNEFDDVDRMSLLTQFISINMNNKDNVIEFNIHFRKSWMRIFVYVRTQDSQAYMYYLNDFVPKLANQIKN